MFFLNKYYAYGLAFLLLSYAVYALVLEPRLELKEEKTKNEQLEVNITVSTANNEVGILDELNKYDANKTQIKIDELEEEYEEIAIETVNNIGDVEWVFFKSH